MVGKKGLLFYLFIKQQGDGNKTLWDDWDV
jgi:hypothetical protein